MPLTKLQNQLLEECGIDHETRQFLGRELGENGEPLHSNAPDFLYILCNLLQITEKRLEYLRNKFANKVDINGQQGLIAEPPPDIALLEEEIKNIWLRAAALWRATDLVVRNPQDFSTILNLKHIEYALAKNNLPVIEMLKYARPDFFALSPSPKSFCFLIAIFASLIGAITGMIGGFMGALKWLKESNSTKKNRFKFLAYPYYAFIGIISGSAMGFMTGFLFGMQTGNLPAACKLAYKAAYLNPMHEPRGTKYSQAVELQREEILFEMSHEYLKSKDKAYS